MNAASRALAAALAVWVLASLAHAQEPSELAVGSRVRVTATGAAHSQLVGNVLAADERTLTVISDNRPVKVPRDQIARLDVGWGRQRHVVQGLLIGAAVGLVIGATSQLCESDRYGQMDCMTREEWVAAGVVGGAAWGALIGAFVKSDKWVEMPFDRVRVGVRPGPSGRGLGVSLALRF